MKQEQFKSILESIEIGLYDKWEKNVKEQHPYLDIVHFIANREPEMLVSEAFIWHRKGKKHGSFWIDIEDRYQAALKKGG